MLVIGLTGSIATGKSTTSRLLTSPPYSLPLIDADVLARAVVAPGTPGLRAIVAHFGASTPDLLNADGSLNRKALGRRIFGDSEEARRERAVLNGITHPLVRRAMAREILRCWVKGCWAVVVDVPLLFEAGLDVFCGAVVVVAAEEEVQMRRLVERDGAGREDAERRVRSQRSVREKVEECKGVYGSRGWVVNNNEGLEELEREVARVVGEMRRGREGLWRVLLWLCPPVAAVVGGWRVFMNWLAKRRWAAQQRREAGERAKL